MAQPSQDAKDNAAALNAITAWYSVISFDPLLMVADVQQRIRDWSDRIASGVMNASYAKVKHTYPGRDNFGGFDVGLVVPEANTGWPNSIAARAALGQAGIPIVLDTSGRAYVKAFAQSGLPVCNTASLPIGLIFNSVVFVPLKDTI